MRYDGSEWDGELGGRLARVGPCRQTQKMAPNSGAKGFKLQVEPPTSSTVVTSKPFILGRCASDCCCVAAAQLYTASALLLQQPGAIHQYQAEIALFPYLYGA